MDLEYGTGNQATTSWVLLKKENMNRETEIIHVNSTENIPSIETIQKLPRLRKLKLIFADSMQMQREAIGENLKKELNGFQVSIHTTEPEINIAKLITDHEIELRQDFFELAAKEHRQLAQKLIYELVDSLSIVMNENYPLESFNSLYRSKKDTGKMNDWIYYLHGFHCCFDHQKTGQHIEVPLVFGFEFGSLDPYFFTSYIKSTPQYQPLPVEIFEDYADGKRIIDKMVELKKFEIINSNLENYFGVVVADREKIAIEVYRHAEKKKKFGLLRFLKLK